MDFLYSGLTRKYHTCMWEIGKWQQLNETEWYEAVGDLSFFRDEKDFEILFQASFNEQD